ncbi:Small-conductance mechanosensitive channel [termite gut metagenome]|uniref:Small-conductance mechanosensitive channel n=1 Tax=termite gut metagenome TaxID=433724 RepID=A0A5J4QX38_9ZZZZ
MNLQDFLDIRLIGIPIEKPLFIFIKAILIYVITRVGVSVVKFMFRRANKKKSRAFLDQTVTSFIQRFIIYTLYTLGGAVVLSGIPGIEKIGNSILAGAGIVAMAVGFASKEALSNFIGGLFIVFGKPFRLGDKIKIDNTTGVVSMITLRHTIIRNAENHAIIIPNSTMNTCTIVNSTIGDLSTCSLIEVGVAYHTPLDTAIETMREEIMKHPLLIDHRTAREKKDNIPQVVIRVVELGDSAITLKAWAWASDVNNAFVLKCDILKSVKERFDKEGIEIPYPCNRVILTKNGEG